MKTICRNIWILVFGYCVAAKTWHVANKLFAKTLVEAANRHPEMTLAELIFNPEVLKEEA